MQVGSASVGDDDWWQKPKAAIRKSFNPLCCNRIKCVSLAEQKQKPFNFKLDAVRWSIICTNCRSEALGCWVSLWWSGQSKLTGCWWFAFWPPPSPSSALHLNWIYWTRLLMNRNLLHFKLPTAAMITTILQTAAALRVYGWTAAKKKIQKWNHAVKLWFLWIMKRVVCKSLK